MDVQKASLSREKVIQPWVFQNSLYLYQKGVKLYRFEIGFISVEESAGVFFPHSLKTCQQHRWRHAELSLFPEHFHINFLFNSYFRTNIKGFSWQVTFSKMCCLPVFDIFHCSEMFVCTEFLQTEKDKI